MARSPFFSRLIDRVVPETLIKRLSGGEEKPVEDAENAYDDDPPELSLEELLKEDIGAFGGKMHIISLVEFKEAIGSAKWLKLSTNIMLIAEGVLRSRLGHAHSYVQRGSDMFLLGFRGLSDTAAKLRAVEVAEEIGGRLAGAAFGSKQALVRTAEVDPEDLLTEDGELDEKVLHAAVAEGESVQPVSPKEAERRRFHQAKVEKSDGHRPLPTTDPTALKQPGRRFWTGSGTSGHDDGRRRQWETEGAGADYDDAPPEPDPLAEAAARAAAEQPRIKPLVKPLSEAERRHFEAMHGGMLATLGPEDYVRSGGSALDATDRLQGGTATSGSDDPAAEDAPPQDPATRNPAAVEAMLRPCWTAATEAADTFLLRPRLTGGSVPAGETRAPGADNDAMIAAKAVEVLEQMAEKAPGAVLVVPLHCLSLGDPDRRPAVLGALNKASAATRMKALRVEVVGITQRTPAARVMNAIDALRPIVREVALRTDLADPARVVFGLRGVLVGADAEDLKDRPPKAMAERIRALEEKARLGGATGSFLWGLRKRGEIALALDHGIGAVGGPALSRDIPPPGKALRLSKGRLLGKTG
ncbi:hypothetical protein C882_4273 [Caenispirillum salinarum AK4]|uniref:Uncharacterized protein n=1 Tax=Caenispirillum salinarum AK4 TaxID=1238182 RepID=K9HR91_9PROT|nr:hypothetical protein [Caenispirillum salinarum]EKV30936.1 hypothetical protein C882_4273 [Caenispirillum salinarum AK4]